MHDHSRSAYRHPIAVLLRVTIVLQCLGHARWMLDPRFGETPILSLLWSDPEFGGFGWSETTAQTMQHGLGWFFVAAALLTLVRPCLYVLAPVTLVQTAIAFAMWRMDIGVLPEWAATSGLSRFGFSFASHSLRIAAPLLLALIGPWPRARVTNWLLRRTSDANGDRRQASPLERRWRVAEFAMRWAIAMTFVGHGLKALSCSFEFQNLIALSAQRSIGWSPSQASLDNIVRTIGAIDLVSAALLVTVRWRTIAWWMAFWGLITAASRIASSGWTSGQHHAVLRATHAGVPAVLALYWSWRRRIVADEPMDDSPKKHQPHSDDSI